MPILVADYLPKNGDFYKKDALSPLIATMEGSRILAIAQEVKELQATGVNICDLSVGDFDPTSYKAPQSFLDSMTEEIQAGRNQYPPSDGLAVLRQSISDFYAETLGVKWDRDSIVVCGGARPPIYAIFRALISPGDKVVYSTPSWNNDYYSHLTEATQVPIVTTFETNFLLTLKTLTPHLSTARMVCLCSPMNPTGTVFNAKDLKEIVDAIVAENNRRLAAGERLLYLLFDQVYWPLTYNGRKHYHPIALNPEISPYVLYVDAISKWMVGTGLRLGWAMVPKYLYNPIKDFMGHVGSWAPRPVQAAAAITLSNPSALSDYWVGLRGQLESRLGLIFDKFQSMAADGLPVRCTKPQGAIYASTQINLFGQAHNGKVLETNHDIRRLMLHEARIAIIPFQAFSLWEDTGWFRMSIGAVSETDLREGLDRLEQVVTLSLTSKG